MEGIALGFAVYGSEFTVFGFGVCGLRFEGLRLVINARVSSFFRDEIPTRGVGGFQKKEHARDALNVEKPSAGSRDCSENSLVYMGLGGTTGVVRSAARTPQEYFCRTLQLKISARFSLIKHCTGLKPLSSG